MGHERLQTTVGSVADHADGGVPRLDEIRRDLHDAREQLVQRQVRRHADDRIEEQLPPGPVVQGAVHAGDHLTQKVVEPRSSQVLRGPGRIHAHAPSSGHLLRP
ncbi:hypothetical protein GCM10027062_08450 [Nocardioides hungaricus]